MWLGLGVWVGGRVGGWVAGWLDGWGGRCVCVCNSYIGGPCPYSYPFPLKGVAQSVTVFTHSALQLYPVSVPYLKYDR